MPESYQHLRTRLRIEQSRHLNWGEQIGLLEESLESPSQVLRLHRNVILDVLLEVNGAFASTLNISSKYDEFISHNVQTLNATSTKQSRFLERARRCWQVPGRAVSRLQWATITQERFERLIARLVGYNDSMQSILDQASLKDLSIMQERSNLMLLQLTEKVSQLHTLTKALEIRPVSTTPVTQINLQSSTSVVFPNLSVDLKALAVFKIQNLNTAQDAAAMSMLIVLEKIHFIPDDPEKDRSLAQLDNQPVFVEWRTPLDIDVSTKDAHIIEDRLNQLAFLLNKKDKPSGFRCPRCIGYCRRDNEDDVQYGLIFDIPSSGNLTSSLATLRDYFHNIYSPPLTARIALANAMVGSLLYLHAVNWLHKGFRSNNILFYIPDSSDPQSKSDLTNPLISGFDFSRQDNLDETTVKSAAQAQHDYYKHPQLLQHSNTRSQKSHDIYALGVVLIEVSLWRPVEDIMASITGRPLTTSQIPKIRQRLLSEKYENFPNVITAVAARSGANYAGAVRRCIEGGQSLGLALNMDESDPDASATLQRVFFDEIYLKIQSVHT